MTIDEPTVDEQDRVGFGMHVGHWRRRARVSQRRLAELTGLQQPMLSRIELGRRGTDIIEAIRIAEALEISLDDLVAGPYGTRTNWDGIVDRAEEAVAAALDQLRAAGRAR